MSARTALHAIWILYAAVTVVVVVTYARLPVEELYHVSHGGLAGGFGRVLVFLGYPVSLGAIGIALVSLDRLLGGTHVSASTRRVAIAATAAAVVLCATVAFPGVIDQGDLDAKPANGVAAVGVLVVLLLTVGADRLGRRDDEPRVKARTMLLVSVALAVVSLPWLAALLGSYVDRAPLLGRVFLASELRPEPGQPDLRAVHLGDHHGFDGILLTATALLLLLATRALERRGLRVAVGALASLMLVYGAAAAFQDFWLEQLFKRGTTTWTLPGVITPEVSDPWAVLLVAAAVVYFGFVKPGPTGLRVAGALGCVAVVAAFVALGEDEYTVPDVTGLTVGIARSRLEQARLGVTLSTPPGTATNDRWLVCGQSPMPGARAERVTLLVAATCAR